MGKKTIYSFVAISLLATAFTIIIKKNRTEESDMVQMTRPPVMVEIVNPVVGNVEEFINVVGTLSPRFEASIHSEYPGIVEEVPVIDWVEVSKGDVLVTLDRREIMSRVEKCKADIQAAEAEIQKCEAVKQFAEKDFERITTLNQEKVVAEKNFDDSKRAKDMADADLAMARARLSIAQASLVEANLQLNKSVIRSPIDGTIASRKANIGDRVDGSRAGEPLFRIVNNQVLDLILAVPSYNTGKIYVGQKVIFATDAFPDEVYSATIEHINPLADNITRASSILAQVANTTGRLRNGLFVKGQILITSRQGVLLVPQSSVLEKRPNDQSSRLFVAEGSHARVKNVVTGLRSGNLIEVMSGINLKDQVVTRGAFMVHDGDLIEFIVEDDEPEKPDDKMIAATKSE